MYFINYSHHITLECFRALKKIGIQDANAYRNGDWFGNSSLEGETIFRSVSFNFSDLIKELNFVLENGEILFIVKKTYILYEPREIYHRSYGRCFEIKFRNEYQHIAHVNIKVKKSLYIYIGIPFHFLDQFTRTKLEVNVGESLFMEVNYELHKNNYGKGCRKYPNVYTQSYDRCKTLDQEENIMAEFNCTVPFFGKSRSNLCRGTLAKIATKYYVKKFLNTSCPDPCHNMISSFGFPFVSQEPRYNGTGSARLYFRKIIKQTEDYISYDLLR